MSQGRNSVSAHLLALSCSCLVAAGVRGQDKSEATLSAAQTVLREFTGISEQRIPESLLRDAQGIAVIPNVIKVGFVAGVRHGRGVVLVRDGTGNWQLPGFIELTGGSVGWQAGAQATDVVLVFRSQRGLDNLLRGTVTLGADAAVAAGPIGRQAQAATDAQLKAEILSYSRSRGLFAGVALDGSVIRPDHWANATCYGYDTAGSATRIPESATALASLLAQLTGGTTASIPAVPAVPTPATTSTFAPAAPPSLARSQAELASALNYLLPIVDPTWQTYLALPPEAFGPAPDGRAVQNTLSRYEQVAADPRYRALTERREFQAALRAIKAYAEYVRPATPAAITLPPPPAR
jgi:lipid-binding SYLF domain-containing protein